MEVEVLVKTMWGENIGGESFFGMKMIRSEKSTGIKGSKKPVRESFGMKMTWGEKYGREK